MARRTGVVTMPQNIEAPAEKPASQAKKGSPKTGRPTRKRTKKTDSMSDDSEVGYGKIDDSAIFDVSRTEGDTFRTMGQYRKAIASYTKALALRPEHKACLLSRSQCYQQVSDNSRALADANKTLEDGSNFIRGLLQKADCYYQMSEFEYALVFYHRGNKLRPEIQSFRLGVQKSQEAIDNAIGDKAAIQLTKEGDLSFFAEEQKPDASKRREAKLASSASDQSKDGGRHQRQQRRTAAGGGRKHGAMDSKTVKQLLGELYADKEYLEKLLEETENCSKSKAREEVIDLASTCLDYLDTRTEFWHQQQPTYSKHRDQRLQNEASKRDSKPDARDPSKCLISNLKWIDSAMNDARYKAALDRCKDVLTKCDGLPPDKVSSLQTLISNVHSYAGNAQLELGRYKAALKHHNIDHDISTKQKSEDGLSRAKDNLGRVYIRMGQYKKAIEIFEEKLPMGCTDLEKAWLYHEIGRCNLELNEVDRAKEFGNQSLEAATIADDSLWQLNAKILIAQAEVKLKHHESALESFQSAYYIADKLNDKSAQQAIKKAINDVKNAMAVDGDERRKSGGELVETEVGRHPHDEADDSNVFITSSTEEETKDKEETAKTTTDSTDDSKDIKRQKSNGEESPVQDSSKLAKKKKVPTATLR